MSTTAQKLQAILDSKEDIASAIKEKGGTVPATLAEYGDSIRNLPLGDDSREQADVVFIDYDGEIVATYSAEQVSDSSFEMPALPTHDGLVNDGWNWTKKDMQECLSSMDNHMTIGCTYHTSDDKTRIYIDNTDESLPNDLQNLRVTVLTTGATVTVDFGDGDDNKWTMTTTQSPAHLTVPAHTYVKRGQYVITISVDVGDIRWDYGLFDHDSDSSEKERYSSLVRKTFFGSNVEYISGKFLQYGRNLEEISLPHHTNGSTLWTDMFMGCGNLKAFVIPSGITTAYGNVFRQCISLRFVSMPKSYIVLSNNTGNLFHGCLALRRLDISPFATSFGGNYMFSACQKVEKIVFPAGVTTIGYGVALACAALRKAVFKGTIGTFGQNTIQWCYNLEEVVFENDCITMISARTFENMPNLRKIVFKGFTQVPELEDTNVFNYTPIRQILVPMELYSTWIASTNWSSTTNNIVNSIVAG